MWIQVLIYWKEVVGVIGFYLGRCLFNLGFINENLGGKVQFRGDSRCSVVVALWGLFFLFVYRGQRDNRLEVGKRRCERNFYQVYSRRFVSFLFFFGVQFRSFFRLGFLGQFCGVWFLLFYLLSVVRLINVFLVFEFKQYRF